MSWTKGQIVDQAFIELALAGYEFDITPEELQSMLRKLDTMMASWLSRGISLGYAFGTDPNSTSLTTPSGIPLLAIEAVYLNLAIRNAASKGKSVPGSLKSTAKDAYDSLLVSQAYQQLQLVQNKGGTPSGAGNKPWRNVQQPFLPPPDNVLANDGSLNFLEN